MIVNSGLPSGIASMEPMLPDFENAQLSELSHRIFIESGALRAVVPNPTTRQSISNLVCEMNSYYSNLIEGHKTLPRDIESALHDEFVSDDRMRLNQHLSRAHILVQEEMEHRLDAEPELNIYSPQFLCWLHESFYAHLPVEASYGHAASGKQYQIEAGILRAFNVDVGAHTPPDCGMLGAFLERYQRVYARPDILPTDRPVAIAAAHHRLAWIHPFGDGNGRVARLHSHAALIRLGVDGEGLWTLSRGLARFRSDYYARLAAADQPRQNDYDGRGNLSAKGLTTFCVFFLETILDQVQFMGKLLGLAGLLHRIEDYIYRESGVTKHQERLVRLLAAAVTEGSIPRGGVGQIVGLKPSASRQVIALGLEKGLLQTSSPKGPLCIAFPAKVLDAYFPRLFLDLPYGE